MLNLVYTSLLNSFRLKDFFPNSYFQILVGILCSESCSLDFCFQICVRDFFSDFLLLGVETYTKQL